MGINELQLYFRRANMAPGPQRRMKLAALSSHISSIGINDLQLYFRRELQGLGGAHTWSLRKHSAIFIQPLHLGRHFESLDGAALRDLESEMELMVLYAGEVLYRQGEAGDFMCIVISGRVRVVAAGVNNAESPVDELGGGETVGEMRGSVRNRRRGEL